MYREVIIVRMTLGHLVQRLRHERGLSQIELAEKVGIEQTTLSAIERGRTAMPSIEILHRLADELNVPDDLLLRAAGWIRDDPKAPDPMTLHQLDEIARVWPRLTDEQRSHMLTTARLLTGMTAARRGTREAEEAL